MRVFSSRLAFYDNKCKTGRFYSTEKCQNSLISSEKIFPHTKGFQPFFASGNHKLFVYVFTTALKFCLIGYSKILSGNGS